MQRILHLLYVRFLSSTFNRRPPLLLIFFFFFFSKIPSSCICVSMQQCRQTHAAGCHCPIRSLPLSNFHSFSCSFPPTHSSLFSLQLIHGPNCSIPLLHVCMRRVCLCSCVCVSFPFSFASLFYSFRLYFFASASSVSSLLFLSFFRSFFMQLSTNCIKPIRSRICIIVLSLSVLLFSCPCHCRLFKFTCFPHKSVNCSPPHSPHNAFTSIPNFLHSLFVCFSPPSLPPSICVNCVPPAACSPSCNRSADLYMRHPPFCILPCLLHCLQAENSQNIKKTKKKKRWMHNRRNQSRLKKNRERRMHRTNRIRL